MSNHQYKCPCGNSTYTIKYFMDDWNRSEEQREMDCHSCKQNYQLYTCSYFHSGMECSSCRWVPKESYKKVEDIGIQLNKTKKDIIDIATSRYLDKWLMYFQNIKTKKGIWRELTDNGKKYPSLSTFYAHTKNESLNIYLRREFTLEKVPTILQKIDIIDNEINDKLQQIKQIEDKLRKATEQLWREGYR